MRTSREYGGWRPLWRGLSLLLGSLLIALAIWAGMQARSVLSEAPKAAPELVDTRAERVYRVDAWTGEIQVLSLRGQVQEIGRLRETAGLAPRAMELVDRGAGLRVEAGQNVLIFDTRSLRLRQLEATNS